MHISFTVVELIPSAIENETVFYIYNCTTQLTFNDYENTWHCIIKLNLMDSGNAVYCEKVHLTGCHLGFYFDRMFSSLLRLHELVQYAV